jgi:phospholipase C
MRRAVLAGVIYALAAAGCHSPPTVPDPTGPCGLSTRPPSVQHVVWIWMENRDVGDVIGASPAPYINQLASQCGQAVDYFGVDHPSLPNYIAAVSGSTQGIVDDEDPAAHPLNVPSLYSQLKSIGLQWRNYEEGAPGNCPSTSSGLYAVRHDPAPYFVNIAADCRNWDVPMGSTLSGNFITDLNAGRLPAFSFITPDVCHDAHDCEIDVADRWLALWIPTILNGPNYRAGNTAIFIIWDEGTTGNHVPAVVVSPFTPVGAASATRFDHFSLLRTTAELLGITTHLGSAATAASMLAPFFGG